MRKYILLLLLMPALTGTAQENEKQLDPVTITASLHPRKISQTGRNLVTFKGEDFAAMPVQSIDELLRYLPGVEVQMRGPMGAQSDIVLRGGTFQQVLVLLDGVRLNDPNTGHFNSYIPISPAEIERVEILKGASSAIYGAEAVGGVIQVITKTFAARRQQDKWQVNGQLTGGEYGLWSGAAGGFYQKRNTAFGGGLLINHASGQPQRGTKGFADNKTASLSVTHFLNEKWQLALRGAIDNRDFSAQNFYTTFASDTAQEEVGSMWTQLRLSYTGGRHRVQADAGYKQVSDEYQYNNVAAVNENKSRLFQATITDEWKLHEKWSLVSGVQFINKKIRSNDRGNHELWQGGLFVVAHYQPAAGFTINPALRADWNEISGTELVPQINFSYQVDKWQLRAGAGKTIRDADFTERYNNYNKAIVTGGSVGNPGLQAERSFSYEAGADYFAAKGLRISASFFQRRQKNIIDWAATPYDDMPRKDNLVPGNTYALARNIAAVVTTGAELDLQYRIQATKNSGWYAAAGVVWMNSNSEDAAPSFYISSHAKVLTNFFVEYQVRHFSISLNGIYKEREPQKAAGINAELFPDYFVVNGRMAVLFGKKRWQLFTQVNNIGNQRYSDLLGAVMPRRWLMAGIAFRKN
mgnify:CR=1 FL=1